MTTLLPPLTTLHQRAAGILSRVLVAAALSGMGALLGRYVATNPDWRVGDVRFVGNTHAEPGALRHLSDIRTGTHLVQVDLERAVAGVERHPWVKHAEARRVFPGAVEITVDEYVPVMILALDRLWYVDQDGVPFTPAQDGDLDLPVLTGLDPNFARREPDLSRAVVAGALRVLNAWQTHAGAAPADDSSEVAFHAAHGYDLVLRSGTRLILGFGDPSEPLAKLDRLVVAGLDLNTPQRVDLDMETVAVATPLPKL